MSERIEEIRARQQAVYDAADSYQRDRSSAPAVRAVNAINENAFADISFLLAEVDRCRKVVEAAKACVAEWNAQLDRNPLGDRNLAQEWWHLGAPYAARLMVALDEYEKGGGR